ncbi:MAG: hypothetical protein OXC07_04640 [Kistimonas sp.]|nr:hypothetical protein [Kistimonas sp.]
MRPPDLKNEDGQKPGQLTTASVLLHREDLRKGGKVYKGLACFNILQELAQQLHFN